MVNYYGGTSGLVLPIPNKALYPLAYQDKSRLCFYASLFNSIEINSSFYKIPQAKTIARWAEEVPGDFRFTFKFWRGVTHEKGLAFNSNDVNRFMQTINAVGEKKGCLLLQFPPSAKANLILQLHHLVGQIRGSDSGQTWNIAMEFRDKSWYSDQIRQFIHSNKLSIVLQDIPASATPIDFIEQEIIYLRFHGPDGRYRGSYQDDVLEEYSIYIREWQTAGKTVYVYFNNTMGNAVNNLSTLTGLVQQSGG